MKYVNSFAINFFICLNTSCLHGNQQLFLCSLKLGSAVRKGPLYKYANKKYQMKALGQKLCNAFILYLDIKHFPLYPIKSLMFG